MPRRGPLNNQPARRWVFTLNNPEGRIDEDSVPRYVRYCVYQEEVGETGTHHFQGYVELGAPQRLSALSKWLPRAHWEIAMADRVRARAYAMKEDTRVGGPYEFGHWEDGGQGQRSDVQTLVSLINSGATTEEIWTQTPVLFLRFHRAISSAKNLSAPPHREIRVTYVYGPPGTGKSAMASTTYPLAYWKPKNKWWDGYESQSAVILDDWDGTWFSWTYLMKLLDRYPLLLETKGGTVKAKFTEVVITTNRLPEGCYNPAKFPLEALTRRVHQWMLKLSLDCPMRLFDGYQSFWDAVQELHLDNYSPGSNDPHPHSPLGQWSPME